MKLFRRRPKPPSAYDRLRAQLDANPGVWFDWPDNVMVLGREAFFRYEVRASIDFDSVQIRRRAQP